ncbi:MAG: DUF3794 domain-containing protein [Desulfotomaculaceae bacterium]|nr:DUF3794 domain-containing protein [Desulfotomaculaceae bacterium]
MPEQYYYAEEQPVRCVELRLPLVIESVDVESVIDSTLTLPELAIKIDKIVASVRDVKATPVFVDETHSGDWVLVHKGQHHPHRDLFVKKIIVSGILHKQIFYVNKNNEVRHTSEDLPFSKMQELDEPRRVDNKNDVFVEFRNIDVDISWELHRASRVRQTALVQLTAKVMEEREIYVQTCPPRDEMPHGNLVKDGGFEAWAGPYSPIFWGGSNVAQTSQSHSGSYAAELGLLNPAIAGALFQMIRKGVAADCEYRLSFWVKEDALGNNSNFTLTAEVVYFDEYGMQIGIGSETLTSAGIPDNGYSQVQVTAPMTDESVESIMVRFNFNPGANNTNTVKIDDVKLECTRRHGRHDNYKHRR